MFQSAMKNFTAVALVLGLLAIAASPSFAKIPLKVLGVAIQANPVTYQGECPATIKFTGKIAVNGPGVVKYRFIRSDGAIAPIQTLLFSAAGVKYVSTTWTLGGPSLPTYSGWEAIQILYPNSMVSNKAFFKVICGHPTIKKPDLVVRISGPLAAKAGDDIGPLIKLQAFNIGSALAPGTTGVVSPPNGYMIDVMLSKDTIVPPGFAVFSPTFVEDALLQGGRTSVTVDLAPGASKAYVTGARIPPNTPTGLYYVTARIDPGNKVAESNEANNVAYFPIKIKGL